MNDEGVELQIDVIFEAMKTKAFFNWSGGKDSALALYKILTGNKYSVEHLVTTISKQYKRISMHGVREKLLDQQAENIGIPLEKLWLPDVASMDDYDEVVTGKMKELKEKQIEHAIFGDIFLEDLKKWREEHLAKVGMKAVFPLWKNDSRKLVNEFIDLGFKTIVVSVDTKYLDESFAGRIIDRDFLKQLPTHVDPCGENGEFHSFVFDGPIFKKPVSFTIGEKLYKEYPSHAKDNKEINGFWYCDLMPLS
ncbi:MAG TPA: diphthine--ammonia ligase [Bacteroidales bacterium]